MEILGVLNITPDSFSDGDPDLTRDQALIRGLNLARAGAGWVDVGGESTRPGAKRVETKVEADRVLPVIEELVRSGVRVSVDSTRSEVASQALRAGARMVNDVSGGLADPEMFSVVARASCDYVITHWRGPSEFMDSRAVYDRVTPEVLADLRSRLDAAKKAGIAPERIIIDPGLGFAKTADHNWEILRDLSLFSSLGPRILIGASRKRFLAQTLPESASLSDRDLPTSLVTLLASWRGVWGVRVHDVAGSVCALRLGRLLGSDRGRATVSLRDLQVFGCHGVYASERRREQRFLIDLDLELFSPPEEDNLAQTVDYSRLAETVAEAVEGESVELLESLARRIAVRVGREFSFARLRIGIKKPEAPLGRQVQVGYSLEVSGLG